MSLRIETGPPVLSTYVATKRLYLTADRERLVEHGDPEAAILFAAEGTIVEQADAERYGLLAPPVSAAASPSDPPAAPRARRR